ncbi:Ltp family lipoprotein [Brevundimonas subvibrioides]|uniref:Ltp family lipoprotein n=1 Tax=Brevundimonas subvibrioides TaxID=74313 RepID=UPI0022B43DC0|nr:Ltp family lipoprotein [Brevundimonas subvibrioides]
MIWSKTIHRSLVAASLLLVSCGVESTAAGSPAEAATADERAQANDEASTLTGPQRNAVRSARQYLSMTGFSRDGLIAQLSSEYGDGYDVADATVAVDSLDVDWNANAARSAEQYLNMTGFSCRGLVEQLSSSSGDKYTEAQAQYGAQAAGACS